MSAALASGAGGSVRGGNDGASPSTPSPRFRSWPITATRTLEPMLREVGLNISADAIDGTTTGGKTRGADSPGRLSDALVSVGPAGRGGTGSFVSDDGLILTNWHVAYDAVRQASIADKDKSGRDCVEEGCVSRSRGDELPGPNYEVWITRSCRDVSDEVVAVVESEPDPLERANRVRDKMQELAGRAQEEQERRLRGGSDADDGAEGGGGGGIRCDVQEMLPNESYVLFTHERLRDVRIVYVPPRSLGNFGGDADNFEWPRHTADFTLLRAYVGPDGRAAEYSPDNVPYDSSGARIRVRKDGAAPGDFVFLLGFPGHTMRYAPSCRLRYSDEVAVPAMVADFGRKLELISRFEKDSPGAALKLGGSKKGLSNEHKRSHGKVVMMRKLGLIAEREAEERALCEAAPEAAKSLARLGEIYDELREAQPTSAALDSCRGIYAGSSLLAAGHSLHEYLFVESLKPDVEREASYRERNLPFLFKRLGKRLGDVHVPHEAALLSDALRHLSDVPGLADEHARVVEVLDAAGGIDAGDLAAAASASMLAGLDAESLQTSLLGPAGGGGGGTEGDGDRRESELATALRADPFVLAAAVLWPSYEADRNRTRALLSERDALFASLLELQRGASDDDVFYPDCNGSLRISAGRVEGYRPADAVEHHPVTTMAGLLDKAAEARLGGGGGGGGGCGDDTGGAGGGGAGAGEYACPERLYDLLSSDDSDLSSTAPPLGVPVCLLYSTDTVGGNSGSPVMNGDGELVAINFDRQRQGLMNEFKWSAEYSRSIGVDVRCILWLIGEYDGASHLVEEMLS